MPKLTTLKYANLHPYDLNKFQGEKQKPPGNERFLVARTPARTEGSGDSPPDRRQSGRELVSPLLLLRYFNNHFFPAAVFKYFSLARVEDQSG